MTLLDDTRGMAAVDRRWLRIRLVRAARELKLRRPCVNVVIVGDAAMSDLHRRHAGVKGTTDVLTFDLSQAAPAAPSASRQIEGEIYICLDEARRRAAELGHEVRAELLLYAVHGLLHLVGYDDHHPEDYQRMHQREDELLRSIGVGAVFARGPGGAP